MPNPEELLFLRNQLCFPLYAASRMTTKIYAPHLQELDLTYPQYLVMLVLWEKDERSVNEISKELHLETNTLTPLLKRLEGKEIICRERSQSDERSVKISLSEKGKDLYKQALEIPGKIWSSFQSSEIDTQALKDFQQSLFKLVNTLEEQVNSMK
ncbi:MarR family winged helix-turn-helix transcriptional regulator [Croceimicrobium sp.]|uniref:MarR family winged helix-turn-helix transcriptional regulator n=1 Tax=Croceimicrobium sp. TaxID=2828340 RepID=UPI003BA862CB